MKIKIILTVISLIIIAPTTFAELLLFHGEGCKYCEEIEAYIDENNLESDLDIQFFEVYFNEENKTFYEEKSREIGYTGEQIPLLVEGDEFRDNKTDIIEYLDSKNSTTSNNESSKTEQTFTEKDSDKLNELISEEKNEKKNSTSKTTKIIGILIVLGGLGIYFKAIHSIRNIQKK